MNNVYVYIGIMFLVTFLIRVIPLTLIRKKIKNVTLRSFLYYIPYVTLSVMTFPAILNATETPWSGMAALIVGIVLDCFNVNLFGVAVSCCAVVFVLEFLIKYI